MCKNERKFLNIIFCTLKDKINDHDVTIAPTTISTVQGNKLNSLVIGGTFGAIAGAILLGYRWNNYGYLVFKPTN